MFWYGLEDGAAARAQRITSSFEGLRFEIQFDGRTYPVESPLVGQINVYNILAAWCAAFSNGIEPEVIAEGIRECAAVPGRFERVQEGQPFLVVVDYAHTDDALRNTIAVARSSDRQTRHHAVRLRRRPRPHKAAADGKGRGGRQRPGRADLRQSAIGGSSRHHERRSGRHPPLRHAAHY